jgi:acetyltransferase-like isoleucine patch superfamily enzyme
MSAQDNGSQYMFSSLWHKFWTRSRHERSDYAKSIIRGLLRWRQNDSPHLVMLGPGVKIDKRNGRFTTGGVCVLQAHCQIAIVGRGRQPANLYLGEGTEVGDRTIINVSDSVHIGKCCSISWDCDINDSDFHQVILPDDQRPPKTAPIVIEDHVWIGSRCLILKGVTIGHHSVIAAGSVVRRDMPPYSLVMGNPARCVSEVKGWER